MHGEVPPLAAVALFMTLVISMVTWGAATGRIRRNRLAGIRTATFMQTRDSWRHGHRLVLPYAIGGSIASICVLAAAAAADEHGYDGPAALAVGAAFMLAALVPLFGVAMATRKMKAEM